MFLTDMYSGSHTTHTTHSAGAFIESGSGGATGAATSMNLGSGSTRGLRQALLLRTPSSAESQQGGSRPPLGPRHGPVQAAGAGRGASTAPISVSHVLLPPPKFETPKSGGMGTPGGYSAPSFAGTPPRAQAAASSQASAARRWGQGTTTGVLQGSTVLPDEQEAPPFAQLQQQLGSGVVVGGESPYMGGVSASAGHTQPYPPQAMAAMGVQGPPRLSSSMGPPAASYAPRAGASPAPPSATTPAQRLTRTTPGPHIEPARAAGPSGSVASPAQAPAQPIVASAPAPPSIATSGGRSSISIIGVHTLGASPVRGAVLAAASNQAPAPPTTAPLAPTSFFTNQQQGAAGDVGGYGGDIQGVGVTQGPRNPAQQPVGTAAFSPLTSFSAATASSYGSMFSLGSLLPNDSPKFYAEGFPVLGGGPPDYPFPAVRRRVTTSPILRSAEQPVPVQQSAARQPVHESLPGTQMRVQQQSTQQPTGLVNGGWMGSGGGVEHSLAWHQQPPVQRQAAAHQQQQHSASPAQRWQRQDQGVGEELDLSNGGLWRSRQRL